MQLQPAALPGLLLLAVALRFAVARTIPADATFAKPDFNIYNSLDKVFVELQNIVDKYPTVMKLEEHDAKDEGYASSLKVVTVEPGGLTSAAEHRGKLRLLLNFGEHGRELITVEVALELLRQLGDPSGAVQQSIARGHGNNRLITLLQNSVFMVIPMENEQGRRVVEAGALCERKNGRGVDTNRNWQTHWGFREKDYDPAEEYPGTRPFSEPEAAMLQRLAEEFQPHVWLNAHSGMEALFMPYDHKPSIPTGAAAAATFRMLQELNRLSCAGRCAIGSGGKSVGYLAHGTATDYMYEVLKVPLAFTWEIFGDMSAHYNDCFRMFNPLTSQHLQQVVGNWVEAIFILLELLPKHPSIPSVRSLARARHGFGLRKIGEGSELELEDRDAAAEDGFGTAVLADRDLLQGGQASWPADAIAVSRTLTEQRVAEQRVLLSRARKGTLTDPHMLVASLLAVAGLSCLAALLLHARWAERWGMGARKQGQGLEDSRARTLRGAAASLLSALHVLFGLSAGLLNRRRAPLLD